MAARRFNPPGATPTGSISRRQFFQACAKLAHITEDEALAAYGGVIPVSLATAIDGAITDPDQRFDAKSLVAGATVFDRDNPFTPMLGAAMNVDSAGVDAIWRLGATL